MEEFFNTEDNLTYNKIDIRCRVETENGNVRLVLQYDGIPTQEIASALAQKLYDPSRQLVEEVIRELFAVVKVIEPEQFTEKTKDATIIPIREYRPTKLQ